MIKHAALLICLLAVSSCGLLSSKTKPTLSTKGSVCGVPGIKGVVADPVPGAIAGCGISDPVRVTSVAGVILSQSSLMNCETAQALNTWVETGAKPAIGRKGGGLKSLSVAAHYACRTRNNQPGGKISEHGRGRAIDISAFNLMNGETLTVQSDWNGKHRSILRKLHASACGPFGTVLGPASDRFHQDHFHFDTANYRSGAFCR